MKADSIGILGGGRIAQALAEGLARRAPEELAKVHVTARSPQTLALWEKWLPPSRIFPSSQNGHVSRNCQVLLLCVKPKDLPNLCAAMGDLASGKLVVSLMAGRSLDYLSQLFGPKLTVVRALPNVGIAVGKGITVCASKDSGESAGVAWTLSFFGRLGQALLVEEALLEAYTVWAGCGPAYVFLFLSLLKEAAHHLGCDTPEASRLTLEIAGGALELAKEYPRLNYEELLGWVRSPGGITDAVCRELETLRWGESFVLALDQGVQRLRQLAGEEPPRA